MMERAREGCMGHTSGVYLSNMGKVWKFLSTGGKQMDLGFQKSLGCWGRID